MRRSTLAFAAVAALLALCSCATSVPWAPYGDFSTISAEQWLGDLDFLEEQLARHPKLRADADVAAAFAAAVERARGGVRAASRTGAPPEDVAVTGIAAALATVGDGHTRLASYPTLVFAAAARWFPASGGGFELRLAATTRPHVAWLGGRITAVRTPAGGLVPVGDGEEPAASTVHGALSALVSREDGLDAALDALACRTSGPQVLMDPFLARGAGLAGGTLTLLFDPATLPPGTPEELVLEPEQGGTYVRVLDSTPVTPLSRKSTEPWWYEIDDAGVLYLQYNQCDAAASPLLDEVAARVERGEVSALVVDLRWNSGGDSRPGSRFVARINATPLGRERGRLYVLVGPITFSSAMMNAVDFRTSTAAIFAGLPLVEPTTHYGEVVRFALPESGVVVARSSRMFRDYGGLGDALPRGVVEPDAGLAAEPTFAEYAAGIDPALEAVFAALR